MTVDLPLLSDAFDDLRHELRDFRWQGKTTIVNEATVAVESGGALQVDVFLNEFWTSRQRAAHSLHE